MIRQISKQMGFWSRAGQFLVKEVLPVGTATLSLLALLCSAFYMERVFGFSLSMAGTIHVLPFLVPVIDAVLMSLGCCCLALIPLLILVAGEAIGKYFAGRDLSAVREALPRTKGARMLHADLNDANAWAEAQGFCVESDFAPDIDEELDEPAWQEEEDAPFLTLDNDMASGLLPV